MPGYEVYSLKLSAGKRDPPIGVSVQTSTMAITVGTSGRKLADKLSFFRAMPTALLRACYVTSA